MKPKPLMVNGGKDQTYIQKTLWLKVSVLKYPTCTMEYLRNKWNQL